MQTTRPTLYRATAPIASIGAQAGDYVMEDGELLCVMRELPASTLSDSERALLRPTTRQRPGTFNTSTE
jgi:hypothetical protein